MLNKRKRGQTTVFIIIGVVIVVGIVLFFILKGDASEPREPTDEDITNPQQYMKTCIEDNVRGTIQLLENNGGYLDNPLNITFQFDGEPYHDVPYLCYTNTDNYCTIQDFSIISGMKNRIKNNIESRINNCWDSLIQNYRNKGYSVAQEFNEFNLNLNEKGLKIKINSSLTATKDNSSIKEENFNIIFPTELYNFGKITNKIIQSESDHGSFNTIEYTQRNPEYKISTASPGRTTIYRIEHRETNEKFRIAVKGK